MGGGGLGAGGLGVALDNFDRKDKRILNVVQSYFHLFLNTYFEGRLARLLVISNILLTLKNLPLSFRFVI